MKPKHSSHLMPIVLRPEAVMVRGRGSYLWDAKGRRYLDFLQGWAVNALGHCPPEVTEALRDQSGQLLTASPALYNAPGLRLAARLAALTGLDQVAFTNSGAEANEIAIKLARKWGRLHRRGAYEVITTHNAFHGRTLATMAASGKPGWDELFPPNPTGFRRVPFGDLEAVTRAVSPSTVAIMVEPVQGEGGVVVPPAGYLRGLRKLADEQDLLLILDEVQTGLGRTGRLFAHEAAGIRPDVLTLGKGLGSGVPIAAVVANQRGSVFEPGDHGGTYHGNPLVTAVALRVLDTISDPAFLQDVRARAEWLEGRLVALAREHGCPGIRAAGLLCALELPEPAAEQVRDACLQRGLLLNVPRPHLLRLMPSLRVSETEIDEMVGILGECLDLVLAGCAGKVALPAHG
jgi:acetylornithine/N-succinyldiaminopimelate aminotransferase